MKTTTKMARDFFLAKEYSVEKISTVPSKTLTKQRNTKQNAKVKIFDALFSQKLKKSALTGKKHNLLLKKNTLKKNSTPVLKIIDILDKTEKSEVIGFLNNTLIKNHEQGFVIEAQASSQEHHEINKLIKRMTLGFCHKKNESCFSMKEGVFAGASFFLKTEGNELTMNIHKASQYAKGLLYSHRYQLQKSLNKHEIKLNDILFS